MGHWCFIIITFSFYVGIIKSNPPSSCTTPNGDTARCISLFSCPILQDAIGLKDESLYKFIEDSSCGCDNGKFMVCCGKFANFTNQIIIPELNNNKKGRKNATNQSHRDFVINELLPSTVYCGLQHTDDYFYNQTVTSVDEFPWILYIPLGSHYKNTYLDLKCAGVLLNRRYALTSSNCAIYFLSTVRIGQYNKHQNVSCIKTSFGEDDCTDPVVEVQIANRYQPPNSNLLLLRLAEKVIYTDYIRPICLPLKESDRPQLGETVITSGWGEEDYEGKLVKIKKRIKHTIVNNEKCSPVAAPFICLTTLKNSTDYVCKGDDGGPIMYKRGNNWFVGGVVASGIECYTSKPFPVDSITPAELEWIFDRMAD